jgi:hypothetical protein
MKWLALAALTAIVACVPGDGPLMEAGENCQGCHGDGKETLYLGERARHATTWTIAGTVYDPVDSGKAVEGSEVQITDQNGFAFSLRSNLAGNFYSKETVVFPLKSACIAFAGQTVCQQSPVTSGSCNQCHNQLSLGAPQPPLAAP